MLKFKKILSLLLTIVLLFTVAGCNNNSSSNAKQSNSTSSTSAVKKGLPPMTKDKITLTYASWYNSKVNEYLAKKFMELYPNITVKLVNIDLSKWNDGLTNLASAGKLPDVFWYVSDCDVPLKNGWLGDMTQYFENDPESADILPTLKVQGYFGTKKKLAAPVFFQPYAVFLDENLFNKLNVPMPSPDWTYSEMIALMKKMTVPEKGIYGYNEYTKIVTMAPIVNEDAWGEFGWNGTKFDLTKDWASAMTQEAEYWREKVHAPAYGSDEAAKAFGDKNLWAADTGKLAMQLDAYWTIELFMTPEFVNKGMKWVPYPVPKGDNAKTLHKPAFIDFGGISSATKHPREAYELLKFMGWGKEGWKYKIEAFKTLKNSDGSLVCKIPQGLPIINDSEIWKEVRALLPSDKIYGEYLDRIKEPIPLGGAAIPGFQTFLNEVYFGGKYGDIEQAIIDGKVSASDVAQDLTDKLNQYHEDTMKQILQIYGN